MSMEKFESQTEITEKDRYIDLINKLKTSKPGDKINVCGIEHESTFMAGYTMEHDPDTKYIKVFFKDGAALEMYDCEPFYENEMKLYFYDGSSRDFDDESFTDYGEVLKVNGESYDLTDSCDKQRLEKVYFGDIEDGEGETVASIYAGADGFWLIEDDGTASGKFARKISVDNATFTSQNT